VLWELQW